ncbi:MAG: efflux RND transporter periplasmic adaptor subunit [Proteobacteria bacterium]|nr:efflux RND transporter periplasmic adaptor subunit [Pseudomonadota bacterium]MBU4470655.1 efflux RND transporter periplasmic adaptor subunit [Pseudomonadota bacterium]MCG2751250.1 efflux RND transporter periplasmic adaptor subunit [Desulfobacteraceae bacterium]
MKRKKRFFIPLWMVLALSACGNKIDPGNTLPEGGESINAATAEVRINQEPVYYEAVATINAHTVGTLSAKIMGTVQAVHVEEGDRVEAGDLLVTLDPRTVTSQLDQAEAALREAKRSESSASSSGDAAAAAAKLASTTYQRYRQLLQENSVSRQEFDEVESRSQQAKAVLAQAQAMKEAARSRVQQAEASVQQATLSSRDARVLAPYKGRVVAKMVNVGNLASPGTPLLTVEQEGGFTADLVLPERHIQSVKVGMPVKVRVPSLGNLDVSGEIGRIVPAADAQSRSFEVKVTMPENSELKSGMFARVFIPLGGTGILSVPRIAVVEQGQLTGVFIVDDNHVARFRLIRTGKILVDQVEVISGLKEGQRYVIQAPVTLQDGMKVEEMP